MSWRLIMSDNPEMKMAAQRKPEKPESIEKPPVGEVRQKWMEEAMNTAVSHMEKGAAVPITEIPVPGKTAEPFRRAFEPHEHSRVDRDGPRITSHYINGNGDQYTISRLQSNNSLDCLHIKFA